ncbi:MAG: hypothetical protein AAF802_15765 [Planctomycetota bacterium]
MKLSKEQTKTLLDYVAVAQPDELDCDGCLEHLAEFVELELMGKEIPEALKKVERHLEQCPCCQDEHNALLEGLRVIEG